MSNDISSWDYKVDPPDGDDEPEKVQEPTLRDMVTSEAIHKLEKLAISHSINAISHLVISYRTLRLAVADLLGNDSPSPENLQELLNVLRDLIYAHEQFGR